MSTSTPLTPVFPPECKLIQDPEGYRYAYHYERPSMTTDSILFAQDDNHEWHVLLILRGHDPYAGCWAFPGGFLNMDETLEECAARELQEETGLVVEQRELLGIFDAVDRDPRGRVITAAYLSYYHGRMDEACAGDDAAQARWFKLNAIPQLAFDQQLMFDKALAYHQQRMTQAK